MAEWWILFDEHQAMNRPADYLPPVEDDDLPELRAMLKAEQAKDRAHG